jgi:septum formation protein
MLILASKSPRRREILERAGIPFLVSAADIPEQVEPGETPREYVARLAREKANAVAGDLVLGADTVVVLDEHILEKPKDHSDAVRMLRLLSGREHSVLTAIHLRHGETFQSEIQETRVHFLPLTEEEIEEYAASGEPMDKAGGYAIQGLASKFIDRIEGDYFNVVGLPVSLLYRILKRRRSL